jgi:hypothetical protein
LKAHISFVGGFSRNWGGQLFGEDAYPKVTTFRRCGNQCSKEATQE